MSYYIDWLVKDRVLLTTFSGIITLDEINEFIDSLFMASRNGKPPVHHISNNLGIQGIEFSLKALQTLTMAKQMTYGMGWQIDVNRNTMLELVSSIASQSSGARTRTFTTADEAITFLQECDPTLAKLVWRTELIKEDETLPLKKNVMSQPSTTQKR
ncbi:MAG TPA: hypothetical protein VHL11_12330 [Phototrophicaceae bacterium]|jgi:hypothetical protein|nr:hypothetical protein [Phototrophicaceae bacterium]